MAAASAWLWSPVVLMAALCGCPHRATAQLPLPAGESLHPIPFGGSSASRIIVHVPESTGAPLPVVLFLHGWYGDGAEICRYANVAALAASRGFIGVCANGDRAIVSDLASVFLPHRTLPPPSPMQTPTNRLLLFARSSLYCAAAGQCERVIC